MFIRKGNDMTANDSFRINEPQVIAEEIDGEAIILNFESGTYYSLNSSAMTIWNALQTGASATALLAQWQATHKADGEQPTADFQAFLAQLQEEQLIVPATPSNTAVTVDAMANGAVYDAPILTKFTDLQNLLLLDPIHEVDEMGWPHPAP